MVTREACVYRVTPLVLLGGMAMQPRHDVWLVTWIDAFDVPNEWTPHDELPGDVTLCQSVGFMPKRQPLEDFVTLVANDDGECNVSNGINIPIVNIVDRVRLHAKQA